MEALSDKDRSWREIRQMIEMCPIQSLEGLYWARITAHHLLHVDSAVSRDNFNKKCPTELRQTPLGKTHVRVTSNFGMI
jgi:hypothetical protein